jgi:hypothetical protein
MRTALLTALALVCTPWRPAAAAPQAAFYAPPAFDELAHAGMRGVIERYESDLGNLRRFWSIELSPTRRQVEGEFFRTWRGILARLDFEALPPGGRIDWLLLDRRLGYELRRLDLDAAQWGETEVLLPFANEIIELEEGRRDFEALDPAGVAERLSKLAEVVEALPTRVERDPEEMDVDNAAAGNSAASVIHTGKLVGNRAAGQARELQRALSSWFRYHDGYDPLFSWWCAQPHARVDRALGKYAKHLREKIAGVDEDDSDTILGDPVGSEALRSELERAWIPYSAEELVEIANSEFEWCDREMLRASQELGFGDDWRAALEHVKGLYVEPGRQPALIRQLATEAVDFLEARELVTIPTLAKNVWRMEMMTPQRQKLTPYFTGGEVISVSFPTSGMAHEDKLMSMRGNNVHFSRATVHHELIPGHHLQQFMTPRYSTQRRPFSTPFWGEGWALYWEMLLWDEGFPRSAEDRVGMLFWRRHRCARIIFSLRFQLGEMSPDECIEFLIERVGHERANATAEVRRSVQGGYGPLYQAAYMIGGLQFRALHRELVDSGRMTNRAFHDAILRLGSIPVELVRAELTGQELARDTRSTWRFYSRR